jgi:hypothetical protein
MLTGRPVAADEVRRRLNPALGSRRLHLVALQMEIGAADCGLVCGPVSHGGAPLVLDVRRVTALERAPVPPEERAGPSVEVGTGRIDGVWWYVLEPEGTRLVPVDEVASAPEVLAQLLAEEGGR